MSVTLGKRIMFLAIALNAASARGEPPMYVDDAGTLGEGGYKLEGSRGRDDKKRSGELVFGLAPVGNLEIGIRAARATDHDADSQAKLRATGLGLKWGPIQRETGWSLGARFYYGNTGANWQSPSDESTTREYALVGLATQRFEEGQIVHLNLGVRHAKAQGTSATRVRWGVGYEYPVAEDLKLTAEIFGEEKSRPDKAIGLRYPISEGFKISGAVGHGNDRSFGQLGFSWEF